MLIHTVHYVDFNGNQQSDTLYFNMSKAEIGKLQVKGDGTYIDKLKDMVQNKKFEGLYDFFYNFILDAYGEKSEDGKRFIKRPEMREAFKDSIAFDEFYTDVISSEEKITNFVRSVIPYDLPENIQEGIPDATSVDTSA